MKFTVGSMFRVKDEVNKVRVRVVVGSLGLG